MLRSLPTQASCLVLGLLALGGCGERPGPPPPAPLEVTTMTVEPRDVPVTAGTSLRRRARRAVNIQARVSGFSTNASTPRARSSRPVRCSTAWTPSPSRRRSMRRRRRCSATRRRSTWRRRISSAPNRWCSRTRCRQGPRRRQGPVRAGRRGGGAVKAQLDSAKLDLSHTVITSPVDGVTSYPPVAEGTTSTRRTAS